ncbi:DNA repair protein [Clostridium botulinum]|uniref:DNA repair protein n=2 Tax=Clostridium botulinum TaxID=1491 RepID=A0A6G4HR59_CLOBO|nr:DNA repair protein [Clostridium botulinum]MBO0570302.1 DNA repair protein [Clostridium botulinum]MBO0583562.1 DNA repair protein [Clostridium botulinum]NFJ59821.1 DNA repair protein [Clostridium botulinum]NFQ64236.1 DNA repair protein [Clostridium botulinum]
MDGGDVLYFEYSRDELLGAAIDQIGHIYRAVDSDLFSSVVHHIIGQQISTRAQPTIWKRLEDRLEIVDADAICSLELEELQKLGMTFRKAENNLRECFLP